MKKACRVEPQPCPAGLSLFLPSRLLLDSGDPRSDLNLKFRRRLLGELCRATVGTLMFYFEAPTGDELVPGRVTSHIPDKGQVMVRTYGLYANAHGARSGKRAASP